MATTLTIFARTNHVEIADLSLAEAQELFGEDKVDEQWGTVRVLRSAAKVRSILRDAGYRTKAAQ